MSLKHGDFSFFYSTSLINQNALDVSVTTYMSLSFIYLATIVLILLAIEIRRKYLHTAMTIQRSSDKFAAFFNKKVMF